MPLEVEVERAARRLADAGVRDARADAQALAEHVAGGGAALDRAGAGRLRDLVERRAAREPLQHLLGTARFRGVDLLVGPGVFTPQPETSSVVDAVVAGLEGLDAPVVVDLCSGAGTIPMSVAHEVPGARVHAVEADPGAFAWLERNRDALGLDVACHLGSAEDALPGLDGRVDVVVSNPPYVAEHELPAVDPEVRDHDPLRALVAGADGLDLVRMVEATAWRLLRPGGLVVVEHSDRQGRSAPAVFARRWRDVADHVDHEGLDRFVTARKP
ncbi:peptide chain release factor N(5)-glutamine methyltransferase [Vallicoccus soli]|uniref:peptide chain release factor N(5)-glutamine methyltransferase n=1 Tax=Vallicoccus soli TaxID=2339232 RepID=A0A3A3ZLP5_9ACTN|nr:peptide chain release factor N(5)-glutamine methyltransferase [Vallicoccus soli]